MTLEEEKLIDFMDRYDISVELDMFDAYFFHDPLCVVISPTFISMYDLEAYILDNYKSLEKRLE